MWRLPFFEALAGSRRILIAGAGGGFDVYAGLPLGLSLTAAGRTVYFGNLSLVNLYELDRSVWVDRGVASITAETASHHDYFPERTLARWLAQQELPATVYAFPRTGVRPLRSAYRQLVKRLDLDAIVLVDGGTDILMRGDEAALGTPVEDATSLAAVAGTAVATGDVALDGRTDGSPLFVNPLMAMYFTFDLPGLAAHSLYLDRIRATDHMLEVSHIIERFRDEIEPRPRVAFPH
jgi:hypothetical protein